MNSFIKKTLLSIIVSKIFVPISINCMDAPVTSVEHITDLLPEIKQLIAEFVLRPKLCYDWQLIYQENLKDIISQATISQDRSTVLTITNGIAMMRNPHNWYPEGFLAADIYTSLKQGSLSSNGQIALFVDTFDTVQFWDTIKNTPLAKPFSAPQGSLVSAAKLSSNGENAFIALCDDKLSKGTLIAWNRKTGKQAEIPSFPSFITAIAISTNEKCALCGLANGNAFLFNTETQKLLSLNSACKKQGRIFCATLSPDEKWSIAGYSSGTLALWDAQTGILINSFTVGENQSISSIQCSSDGYSLLVATETGSLQLFDTLQGICLKKLIANHKAPIVFAQFSPNGRSIIALAEDGGFFAWDLLMQDDVWKITRHEAAKALFKSNNLIYLFNNSRIRN